MAMEGHTVDRHLARIRMTVARHIVARDLATRNGEAGQFAMGAHKARSVAIECAIRGKTL
jgi:S-adenosylmethionine synthetase